MDETTNKKNHNLLFLGLIAVFISLVTTAISVYVYHASGDMYLDRSRPGFLPDEKEIKEELKEDYSFSENDEINDETLETYLTNYKEVLDDLDKTPDPFAEDTLSNESLDI
ncbi:hypothetical protein IJJ18_01635 [Candidatus Saccharibacteria bacterium]|nr:hypothetical protein [Candidatus Saccharibacteria bacterium]